MTEYVHRWSGYPGAYCLQCGNSDVTEDAINCSDCHWTGGPYGMDEHTPCDLHQAMYDAMATCPPDPDKVKALNERIRAARGDAGGEP